ncbi:MAG: tRNA lysidine(34) synthetase TilS [Phycisphaeraceae bacterium]
MTRRPAPHYDPLVRSIARALRRSCEVEPGATVVVACSGGADSVALTRALALLAERRRWRLRPVVAHVQHHLRDEAEDDAAFVERLAQRLGLTYARRDIRPGDRSGNVEANARELRYAALMQIAREHDAGYIATAHHADDQLETLLMRLIRGTSVAGLRGIAPQKKVSDTIAVIRPMLGVRREAVRGFLDGLGQSWREDVTNADTDRTRAMLRREVIPHLKRLQSDAADRATDLAEHCADVYDLLRAAADAEASKKGSGVVLSRDRARSLNRAVLAEVLRGRLIDAGVPGDRLTRKALTPVVEAACDGVGSRRSFGFAGGVELVVTRKAIAIDAR